MASELRLAGALAIGGALALSGCAAESGPGAGQDAADTFVYQVSQDLLTTNAGSLEGASTQAQALSSALYPGVYVPGPNGQFIPNTDLVKTQEIPGTERRVIYTLSDQAVFSDGTPVTCSDYLLAFTAGTNPELFGSHEPLFDDAADLTCTPGAKEFTVVFKQGRGARWRGLFEAGTVLPAHAVAAKLGMPVEELDQNLQSQDAALMRPIADVWRHGFDLAELDTDLQVSYGPYQIDSVGPDGEVKLVANEYYYGDAPREPELTVWPGSADTAELVRSGALKVGDLRDTTPDWFDPDAEGNRLDVQTVVGSLTEALTFPETGFWSVEEHRKALSRCIDPRAVAAASSRVAGVEVPTAPFHVLQHEDPLAARLAPGAQHQLDVDIDAARAIAGAELRVGYSHPSERYAAMVEAMRVSCEPAGVRVTDASASGTTLADLPRVTTGEWGEQVLVDGTVDAVLRPVDPSVEYPAAANRSQDFRTLQGQEAFLWDALPSLPLAAQPVTFAIDRNVGNVVPYTGLSGIGWNMNRWQLSGGEKP